ncbi:MAG: acetate--CoA ligase family protein [Acidimicrobiales bacterium]
MSSPTEGHHLIGGRDGAAPGDRGLTRPAIQAMLEARSIAVVGASPREDSFGNRVLTELYRSASAPEIHLVNPKYGHLAGLPCLPSLDSIPDPVDLVLCCVGDAALEEQIGLAATRGDRSAVVYGSAVDTDGSLRERLATTAREAGMAVCGGGCMGFVNQVKGLRAIGYLEPYPLPVGPIALVTHSGSAFSALLRADRRLGWTVAVSSGQELVTTTASYMDYALELEETRVVALLLETLRSPTSLRASLARAASAGVPVVALTVGSSPGGRAMVAAHSGALAGDDAAWEALFDAHGVIRVKDLNEMADTLELFCAGRRVATRGADKAGLGIATVHDSGAERALVADVAEAVGVRFAAIADTTRDHLTGILDPGLEPGNPLDVWGTGAATRELFAASLLAMAQDDAVQAVALCIDLVPELDGDTAYPEALLDTWSATEKPVCLLTNLPSALDRSAARRLRDAGIPVLEGTRTGLLALRHLVDLPDLFARPAAVNPTLDPARQQRWAERLRNGPLSGAEGLALLADYGIAAPAYAPVTSRDAAVAAAESIGWPVVLKTNDPDIAHKSDVGGVVLDLGTADEIARAYEDLAGRLGPGALVMAMADAGTELALGVIRDPLLGPVVVIGAGGVLVEILADRAVGLPPLDSAAARRLLGRLTVQRVLDGYRGAPAADLDAVVGALKSVSNLALELGEVIEALDINPLRCGPSGAVALDALVVARG